MNSFIIKYFERIGLEYNENEELGYELLKKIQLAHVTTVPYENIDIINRIPISLDTDKIYEKVVTNHRGGYCFELNGLYARLLRELGFAVSDHMARFLRGETEAPKRRHRVIVATAADGKSYICDAGVGTTAPRHPIPLEFGTIFTQFGETYRLRADDFYGCVLEEIHKGEWRDVFGFTNEPQLDIDYIAPSFYCETHPDSIFNKDLMIAIKTPTGRKTLDKNIYKKFEGDKITLIHELKENEIKNCLKEEFGLTGYQPLP